MSEVNIKPEINSLERPNDMTNIFIPVQQGFEEKFRGLPFWDILTELIAKLPAGTVGAFFRGKATQNLNPGTPTNPELYQADPGKTYQYFLDLNGDPIVFPTKVEDQYVSSPFMTWNGSYWIASWSLVDEPSLEGVVMEDQKNQPGGVLGLDENGEANGYSKTGGSSKTTAQIDQEKVSKDDIYDSPENLILGFEHTLWTQVSASTPKASSSLNCSSINLIRLGVEEKLYIYNLTAESLASNNIARLYSISDGTFISSVPYSSLTNEGNGVYSFANSEANPVDVGLLFNNNNYDTASASKLLVKTLIKNSLIDKRLSVYLNDVGFLNNQTGVTQDVLFDKKIEKGDEITDSISWEEGYYNSPSTSLSDALSAPGVNGYKSTSPLSIPNSRYIYVDGFMTPPATMGKIINPDGSFVLNLTISAFELIDADTGSYRLYLNIAEADRFLITANSTDQVTIKLFGGNVTGVVVKSDLIPSIADSDAEALNMYNRGINRNKYTTGVYYGIYASGQSNQEGRAPQSTLPESLPVVLSNVKMFNRANGTFENAELGVNTGTQSLTQATWGYDWGVYKRLADYLAQDIYVIKRTRGGTPLAKNPGLQGLTVSLNAKFEDITPASVTKVTQQAEQVALNAFSVASEDSINIKWKCALWMQGETDHLNPEWADVYYQNLKNWIAYTRGVFQDPQLKIIVLTIHNDNIDFDQKVREAQLKIGGRLWKYNSNNSMLEELSHSGEDPFVYIYDQSGHPFTHIGDQLHMNGVLCELVAEDVFNIIKDF